MRRSKYGIITILSGPSGLTTDSIGAQCPTARSLPLLSGPRKNDTVLSGLVPLAPAFVGAAIAAPDSVRAAATSSRFCRGRYM